MINENLNDPTKFWKLTKSVSGQKSYTSLPEYLKVKERKNIVNAFNSHFIAAGLTSDVSNLAEHNIKGVMIYAILLRFLLLLLF